MTNPRDFLLNTDYEMDKIIFYDHWTAEAGYTEYLHHNLPFTPLLFGVCAFNEDFSDPRAAPYLDYISGGGFVQFEFWSTPEYTFTYYRNDEDPDKPLHFRLYGFEPSDSTGEVPSTSDNANTFVLNTDYNYCKLYQKGIVTGTTTIDHNLGYLPFVLAWYEVGGRVTPVWSGSSTGADSVVVTTSQVIINADPGDKIHYRVYYDEG